MKTRREVLGDEHVDQAIARTTAFTAEFQDLITRYAWGEIWSRPGLDRRTRSCITLTALIALGHERELEMHLRAALRNGVTTEEIKEVILQCAIYCGVPAANSAFSIAQRVLEGEEGRRAARRHPSAVRTPVGRYGGGLAGVRADDLAAPRSRGGRAPGSPAEIDEVSRVREPGRRGQPQRRADGGAARRAAGLGAGRDREPAVRSGLWAVVGACPR